MKSIASQAYTPLPMLVLAFMTIWATAVPTSQGATPPSKNPKPVASDKIELATLVKAVQDALDEAAKHPVEGFPPLQSVSVSAQTTISKDLNGQIKLFVINVGGEKNAQNLSSITFELKPPTESGTKIAPSSINQADIKNALAAQIEAAKAGFLSIKPIAPSSLRTDKVEIEIGFEVTRSISGGVDVTFTLVSSAEISLTGKLTRDTNNTVTLTFANE